MQIPSANLSAAPARNGQLRHLDAGRGPGSNIGGAARPTDRLDLEPAPAGDAAGLSPEERLHALRDRSLERLDGLIASGELSMFQYGAVVGARLEFLESLERFEAAYFTEDGISDERAVHGYRAILEQFGRSVRTALAVDSPPDGANAASNAASNFVPSDVSNAGPNAAVTIDGANVRPPEVDPGPAAGAADRGETPGQRLANERERLHAELERRIDSGDLDPSQVAALREAAERFDRLVERLGNAMGDLSPGALRRGFATIVRGFRADIEAIAGDPNDAQGGANLRHSVTLYRPGANDPLGTPLPARFERLV